jgi:secondary thiamine-phosphate synthase enzyme
VITELSIAARGQGLHAFTDQVRDAVAASGLAEGLCTLFIQHTSASLLIQENYDDSARVDLQN